MPGSDFNAAAIQTAESLTARRLEKEIEAHRGSASGAGQTPNDRFPEHNRLPYGVYLEWQAMGEQPVSDVLAKAARSEGLSFEHIGLTLGTVIHGVNLSEPLSKTLIQCIRQTLLERKVIFFRDQPLSEDQLIQFAERFGELDVFPFGRLGSNPKVIEISHDEARPGSENGWHTDVTWMEAPSLGSIAQALIVPPIGGDTLFADSHAAFRGLPATLQKTVLPLSGVHDYRYFLSALDPIQDAALIDEIKASIPFGVSHPLVRQHPETGKPALYIHGGFLRHESLFNRETGEAMGEAASLALSKMLLAQHARPELMCRFAWQPDSIAFWDNRAVQHYAASDYYPHTRSIRRVTVSGDVPLPWSPSRALS